jgi:hypothetical protein
VTFLAWNLLPPCTQTECSPRERRQKYSLNILPLSILKIVFIFPDSSEQQSVFIIVLIIGIIIWSFFLFKENRLSRNSRGGQISGLPDLGSYACHTLIGSVNNLTQLLEQPILLLLLLLLLLLFNCKWVFAQWQWYYNKIQHTNTHKKTLWSESASELYLLSDRRLSAKWLATFADKGCHVVSVTDPYGRILGFLDRSRYLFIK